MAEKETFSYTCIAATSIVGVGRTLPHITVSLQDKLTFSLCYLKAQGSRSSRQQLYSHILIATCATLRQQLSRI